MFWEGISQLSIIEWPTTCYLIWKNEEKFLCWQLCTDRREQHTGSNIVNFDSIMTDCHTNATGSDNNTYTDSYIKSENTDNIMDELEGFSQNLQF